MVIECSALLILKLMGHRTPYGAASIHLPSPQSIFILYAHVIPIIHHVHDTVLHLTILTLQRYLYTMKSFLIYYAKLRDYLIPFTPQYFLQKLVLKHL